MHEVSLFCKSYHRDFLRLRRLLESIAKFNRDNIPVYVCTPKNEHAILKKVVGTAFDFQWVSDEEIISSNSLVLQGSTSKTSPYVAQGIIKAEFWRLRTSENYLCIDSDSRFLRDFYRSDFIHPSGIPFTVIHENKELLQMARNRGKHRVVADYFSEMEAVRKYFPRTGPDYSFMPSPFLWSAKVWQSLETEMLALNGETLWDVVDRGIGEYHWYGEALLAYEAIPIYPVEPYFRVYHYDWQYYLLKRMGENEQRVADNFMGIIYQSNWEFEMDYGVHTKSFVSRSLRRLKRGARWLESYL
jgi:hypothetical protein